MKETNPKQVVGAGKLPLDLVPDAVQLYASIAFLEGALKYGRFNWRISGVRASTYIAALKRHLLRFANGEWADPDTGVPHLASILACVGIMLDAHLAGKLLDDRAPASPGLVRALEDAAQYVPLLKERFGDVNPHQYTINDTEAGESFHFSSAPLPAARSTVSGKNGKPVQRRNARRVVQRKRRRPVGRVQVGRARRKVSQRKKRSA